MSDLPTLLRRARAFSVASGLALTTVSKRLFADHRRLKRLEAGESFAFPRTVAAASARLDALESARLAALEAAPPAPMNTNRPGRAPNDPPPRRRRNSQARAN